MKNTFHPPLVRAALAAGMLLLFPCYFLQAEDFEGADGLLKKLNDIQVKAPGTGVSLSGARDSTVQFAKDLDSFGKQAESMAPNEAAKSWLELFNRSLSLGAQPGQLVNNSFIERATFSVLPGPAAWPFLRDLVATHIAGKQGDLSSWTPLRLIVDTLNNTEGRQWEDLEALGSAPTPTNARRVRFSQQPTDSLLSLGSALSEMSNQPDRVEHFWSTVLSKLEHGTTLPATPERASLELPDLVTLLGNAKAEPLILRVLLLRNHQVTQIKGPETQALARKLALSNIDKLQVPPWCLTESMEGASLYEALRKKFPTDMEGQADAIYYLIALVTQGRFDEAAKMDDGIDTSELAEATEQAAKAGWGPQVYEFIHSYLNLHPESDLWSFYIDVAGQTGHSADALKFVQDTNARTDLSLLAHDQVRAVLYRSLLAVDSVDEGIEALRDLLKFEKVRNAEKVKAGTSGDTDSTMPQTASQFRVASLRARNDPIQKRVKRDLQLAQIGHLLKRDSVEIEGLDDAVQVVRDLSAVDGTDVFSTAVITEGLVTSYQIETGRYADAERLLIDEIVQDNRRFSDQPITRRGNLNYQAREHMSELALVYYKAERWSDILILLEKGPGWGESDLVKIAGEGAYLARRSTPHLDLMAARALVETGRIGEALPILNYALQEDPGNDAAYALLLKIGKGDLTSHLDALYRRDQFQERPLIWKGVVLLRQGKVADAESACRAAIAVDPSDGEEGKGDRMRVYSVMGITRVVRGPDIPSPLRVG